MGRAIKRFLVGNAAAREARILPSAYFASRLIDGARRGSGWTRASVFFSGAASRRCSTSRSRSLGAQPRTVAAFCRAMRNISPTPASECFDIRSRCASRLFMPGAFNQRTLHDLTGNTA